METKDKILIVEDDETIAAFLIAVLEANGFDTIRASLGREAVTLISSHCPDLVLLDLSLPDMDGMEILAGLRKWSTLPVIVVSARGRERDKVIALDMGADDYLTKPFGPGELLARIRAALRHVRTAAGGEVGRTGVYRCGDLEVDCVRRRVRINGELASEFTINAYMAGLLGIPVVFLSGDEALCRAAEAMIPGIATVTSKTGMGGAVLSRHPDVVCDDIRRTVQAALSALHQEPARRAACLPVLPPRFEMEVEYKDWNQAHRLSFYPGAASPDPQTVTFASSDYREVMRFMHFCL